MQPRRIKRGFFENGPNITHELKMGCGLKEVSAADKFVNGISCQYAFVPAGMETDATSMP